MRPKTYHLARIEPREELAVHLIPWEGSHGFCGVPIWSERTVEAVEGPSLFTIDEFLLALARGEREVGKLTCKRCISGLAYRWAETFGA